MDSRQTKNQQQEGNGLKPVNQQGPGNHKSPEKPSLEPENLQNTPSTSTKEPENRHKVKLSLSEYQKRRRSSENGGEVKDNGANSNIQVQGVHPAANVGQSVDVLNNVNVW